MSNFLEGFLREIFRAHPLSSSPRFTVQSPRLTPIPKTGAEGRLRGLTEQDRVTNLHKLQQPYFQEDAQRVRRLRGSS